MKREKGKKGRKITQNFRHLKDPKRKRSASRVYNFTAFVRTGFFFFYGTYNWFNKRLELGCLKFIFKTLLTEYFFLKS